MDSRQWRERLRADLHRQRLPASYIDRLLEELADHLIDSQTENPSMGAQQALAQLGTTEQLATAARREYTGRTFAGRHPVLTFVLGPVLFVPILFVLLTLGLCLVLNAIGYVLERAGVASFSSSAETEVWIEYWVTSCFNGFVRFIPFASAAWLFCRWGVRCEMRRWALVACCIVALIAGFFMSKSVPAANGQPGLWIIGLAGRPDLRQLIQLLVPLAVAAWFLRRLPRASFLTPTPA